MPCPKCGTPMNDMGSIWACPNCQWFERKEG
jgi:rubrerythrin